MATALQSFEENVIQKMMHLAIHASRKGKHSPALILRQVRVQETNSNNLSTRSFGYGLEQVAKDCKEVKCQNSNSHMKYASVYQQEVFQALFLQRC